MKELIFDNLKTYDNEQINHDDFHRDEALDEESVVFYQSFINSLIFEEEVMNTMNDKLKGKAK